MSMSKGRAKPFLHLPEESTSLMNRLELTAAELSEVTEILDGTEADFERLDAPETLLRATVGSVDDLDLPESVKDVLFEERFVIKPDESHLAKNNSMPGMKVFAEIEEMQRNPERVAVLFGDREQPYARADPYFMSVEEGD